LEARFGKEIDEIELRSDRLVTVVSIHPSTLVLGPSISEDKPEVAGEQR